MTDVTPYDTGERAVPTPWVSNPADFGTIAIGRDPDDFGRVDFEDDTSETVATIHLSKREDGGYTVHITPLGPELLDIEWHGETAPKVTAEGSRAYCLDCDGFDLLTTYRDGRTGELTELCLTCYHDAMRSGADLT